MLRGTSVRGLASLDERTLDAGSGLRPTEQISAEWKRVHVDLSLSCMAPEGRAAMTPYVVGKHATRAIGVVVALFSNVSSSVVGVKFCFVSVFVSS